MNWLIRFGLELLGVRTRGRRRHKIPYDVRRTVMFLAGYQCQRCGSTRNLQIDHVVPHSWGGSDHISNLQVLCSSCNRAKSNHSAADYRW